MKKMIDEKNIKIRVKENTRELLVKDMRGRETYDMVIQRWSKKK